MSFEIEYGRKVYIRKPDKNSSEPNLLLLIKEGSNNVRDGQTGLRVRDWNLITYGWEYRLWIEIGKRAGHTEGGSIQKADRGSSYKNIKIEDYIAIYRKAIKRAKPMERLFEDFYVSVAVILQGNIKGKFKEALELKRLTKAFKELKFKSDGREYYYPKARRFIAPITNLKELDILLTIPKGNYGSHQWTNFNFSENRVEIISKSNRFPIEIGVS